MLDYILKCDSSSTIVSDSAATTAARFAARVFGETALQRRIVRSACAVINMPELEEVNVGAEVLLGRAVTAPFVTIVVVYSCAAFQLWL